MYALIYYHAFPFSNSHTMDTDNSMISLWLSQTLLTKFAIESNQFVPKDYAKT